MKNLMKIVRKTSSVLAAVALVITGCGTDSGSSNVLQPDRSTLSKNQVVETELPPVVFLKYVSFTDITEEGAPKASVSFFSKDGNHYISNDGTLSAMYPNIIAAEFEKGSLQEHITPHTQCEPDELKEEYLKVSNVIISGNFQIIDPTEGPDVEADTVIWYGVYYDESGELQYRLIHKKDAIGEHISDNNDLNEVYAWLLEHEKLDISATN